MANNDISRRKFLGAAGMSVAAGLKVGEGSAAAGEAKAAPTGARQPKRVVFLADERRAESREVFGH